MRKCGSTKVQLPKIISTQNASLDGKVFKSCLRPQMRRQESMKI